MSQLDKYKCNSFSNTKSWFFQNKLLNQNLTLPEINLNCPENAYVKSTSKIYFNPNYNNKDYPNSKGVIKKFELEKYKDKFFPNELKLRKNLRKIALSSLINKKEFIFTNIEYIKMLNKINNKYQYKKDKNFSQNNSTTKNKTINSYKDKYCFEKNEISESKNQSIIKEYSLFDKGRKFQDVKDSIVNNLLPKKKGNLESIDLMHHHKKLINDLNYLNNSMFNSIQKKIKESQDIPNKILSLKKYKLNKILLKFKKPSKSVISKGMNHNTRKNNILNLKFENTIKTQKKSKKDLSFKKYNDYAIDSDSEDDKLIKGKIFNDKVIRKEEDINDKVNDIKKSNKIKYNKELKFKSTKNDRLNKLNLSINYDIQKVKNSMLNPNLINKLYMNNIIERDSIVARNIEI